MVDTAHQVTYAVAEALHVAGRYKESVALFTQLLTDAYRPRESALKSAIGYFAAGDSRQGSRLLDLAVSHGAPPSDVGYVRAQALWAAGITERALHLMTEAARSEPPDGPATNTLGVLLCRQGAHSEGLALIDAAARRSPPDPCALSNRVLAHPDTPIDKAGSALNRAAGLAPHRPEPHLVWSRMARRAGMTSDAALAESRAQLRATPSRSASTAPAEPERQRWADGTVEVSLGTGVLHLDITISLDDRTWTTELPATLTINGGYKTVCVADSVCAGGTIVLHEDYWERSADGSRRIRVHASGTPAGPAVRVTDNEIELGDTSKWMPTFEPGPPIRWTAISADPSPGDIDIPLDGGARGGLGWCRMRDPATVNLPNGATAMGRTRHSTLRRLAIAATAYTDLMVDLLGDDRPPRPKVILVDAPTSTFCYTREDVIRVPTGAVDRGIAEILIGHEVGHLWWGGRTRFASSEEWLAESLAEYTLQRATRCGVISADYRSRTLQDLAGIDRSVQETSLDALAGRTDRLSRHVLRAKGGFFVAMLENHVGSPAFSEALRRYAQLGQTHVLNAFSLCALMSDANAASVDWFVRQWVERDGLIDTVIAPTQLSRSSGAWEVTIEARCRTVTVPGSPVTIEVTDVHGHSSKRQLSVDVAPCQAVIPLAAPPASARLDPDHLFFRTVPAATPLGDLIVVTSEPA